MARFVCERNGSEQPHDTTIPWFAVRRVDRESGRCLLRAVGELDLYSAGALAAALQEESQLATRVVVDMSAVTFCDWAGLKVLVAAHHSLRAAGGELVLTGLRPGATRLLRITGLDRILEGAIDTAVSIEAGPR